VTDYFENGKGHKKVSAQQKLMQCLWGLFPRASCWCMSIVYSWILKYRNGGQLNFPEKGESEIGQWNFLFAHIMGALVLTRTKTNLNVSRVQYMHLMHDYVRLSCLTLKSCFQGYPMQNSQSCVNQKNPLMKYMKVLTLWLVSCILNQRLIYFAKSSLTTAMECFF